MKPPRQLPRYRASLPYGWVVGHFAVLELLRNAPDAALEVRVHGGLDDARRDRLERAAAAADVPLVRDDVVVEAKRSKGDAKALALFAKPRANLDPDADHVLLVRTRDPGNAGTMLRTALAFGVADAGLIGVDAWSPHVVRASLGAVFAMRLHGYPDLAAYRAAHPDRETWLLHGEARTELDEVPPPAGPRSLAVGPEWPGFGTEDLRAGAPVRIAHDPRVESLNAAVALGVALHALRWGRARG